MRRVLGGCVVTRIDLPWTTPPVTLNQRGGPHVRARRMAAAKTEAGWAIRIARPAPADGPVALTLHWRPAIRRRRDVDNPMPTLKAVADALVELGVLADDDSDHVPQMACRIHPTQHGQRPAMWLTITPIEEPS